MGSALSIGVDMGQKVDPTAIVVAEATRQATRNTPTVYTVRDIGRLPLNTSYPDVAAKVANVVAGVLERKSGRLRLLVDATGVGGPVVDLLREALRDKPYTLVACTFTFGDRYMRDEQAGTASVGKAYLVSKLQALLQTGRLKLPVTAESEALARELQDYEIRVDQNANDKYGAFKVGTHDDLVTALGLAVLDDPIAERQRRQLHTYAGYPL